MQRKVINFAKITKFLWFFPKTSASIIAPFNLACVAPCFLKNRTANVRLQVNLWFSKTFILCESDAMQIKKIAIAAAIAASLAFVGCSKKADEQAAEAQDSAAQASAAAADAAAAAADAATATTADATADATNAAADAANSAANAAADSADAAANSADAAATTAAAPADTTTTTTTAPAAQ